MCLAKARLCTFHYDFESDGFV
ncbi:protein of unknown function [Rhodovastum atsumiense]|nr:protein of unknown function [Rhodovastum atsumiense]